MASRNGILLAGTSLVFGLLTSTGAWAQCTGPLAGALDELVPIGRGGSVSALISVIDTANTAFLAGTSAFVGSPQSKTPNQQVGGVWTRAIVGTVDTDNTSVTTGGTFGAPNLQPPNVPIPVQAIPPGGITCQTTTEQDFAGFQVGRDIAQLNLDNSGWNAHFGLTAGYFEADAKDVSPGGTFKGEFQVPFAGLYAVATKGNFVIDGLVRWDFFDNTISDAANGLFNQRFDARSTSVTGNMSYRFDLPAKDGSKWFIEPSVGGVWSQTDVDPLNVTGTFLLGTGVALPGTVRIDDVESILGRASLRVGTNFVAHKVAWQPFATASVFHEFGSDVTANQTADFNAVCSSLPLADQAACFLNFAGAQLSSDQSVSRVGTYGQFGLGVAGQVIDTGWLGYARVDYRTGENIEGVSGNIGLRYQLQPDGPALPNLKGGPSPRVAGPHNWTGLYAGGFAGATWGDEDWTFLSFGTNVKPDFQGYLLGGQAGYNYQAGVWVVGFEGDIGGSNAEGGSSCPNGFFFTCEAEVDTLASLTGRLGYAWDRALFFVKGGVAFGEVTASTSANGGLFPTVVTGTTEWMTGWTLGGGAEFALSDNWSAKGEWMYYDLGSETFVVDTLGSGAIDVKTRGEAVRVGVNYHFGH